jgi:hypothetical protein
LFVLFAANIDPDSFAGVGQPDGSFLVTVVPSQTENVIPEQYTAVYVFTNLTDPIQRKSCTHGQVWVLPDLTKQISASPAQQALSAITAAILALAQGTNQAVTVNGQSYTKKDLGQLQKQKYVLQAEVNAELAQLQRLLGAPNSDMVSTIFDAPIAQPYPFNGPGPFRGLGY